MTADQIARERIRALEARIDLLLSAVAILSGAPLEGDELAEVQRHGEIVATRHYLTRART